MSNWWRNPTKWREVQENPVNLAQQAQICWSVIMGALTEDPNNIKKKCYRKVIRRFLQTADYNPGQKSWDPFHFCQDIFGPPPPPPCHSLHNVDFDSSKVDWCTYVQDWMQVLFNCQRVTLARTQEWRGGSIVEPRAWVNFGTGRKNLEWNIRQCNSDIIGNCFWVSL